MTSFIHTQQLFYDSFQVHSEMHITLVLIFMSIGLIGFSRIWFSALANLQSWIISTILSSIAIFVGLIVFEQCHDYIYFNISNQIVSVTLYILSFISPILLISLIIKLLFKLPYFGSLFAILLVSASVFGTGYVTKSIIHTFESTKANIEDKAWEEGEIPR